MRGGVQYLGREGQKKKTLHPAALKIALEMRHLDKPQHVFPHAMQKEAAGRCHHFTLTEVVKHHI